jgi:hypothetical protein
MSNVGGTVVALVLALAWLVALGFFVGLGWRKAQTMG